MPVVSTAQSGLWNHGQSNQHQHAQLPGAATTSWQRWPPVVPRGETGPNMCFPANALNPEPGSLQWPRGPTARIRIWRSAVTGLQVNPSFLLVPRSWLLSLRTPDSTRELPTPDVQPRTLLKKKCSLNSRYDGDDDMAHTVSIPPPPSGVSLLWYSTFRTRLDAHALPSIQQPRQRV